MLAAAASGAQTAGSGSDPWYLYAGFVAFVVGMLLVDLKIFHRGEQEPSIRSSAMWAGVWIGLGIAFGVIVWIWRGPEPGAEYFAGFVIEKSLSVDNMFVFVLIFRYFSIPFAYQHQVLFYGIMGALAFRSIFIALGVALINRFEWIIIVFGAFLLYTAFKVARGNAGEIHPEHNPVLRFFERRFPTTSEFDGHRLFTRKSGALLATPLFVALLFIELTDIVFAIDSIPAIFGITRDPFIVLTSNVFAILGLRALYFLVAGALNRLHLLSYGLAIVLAFVGVKMLLVWGDIHIPIWFSLPFIVVVLGTTALLSLRWPPKEEVAAPTSRVRRAQRF